MDAQRSEFQESTTIKFEWTLRGLKNIFDSSKGDAKSKVTKSIRFGRGRWQIMFYANSGTTNTEGQGFVSLYLSCEPTTEEKESAFNGKWVREGSYQFGFELRNVQKTICYNSKEAQDHCFSWRTQNWGWAQFAKRDIVYYTSNTVRAQDAFLIICTITSVPTQPTPPPSGLRQPVPRDLLHAMGGLLDDPMYSDVEFVLHRRGRTRRIYAARRLLRRVEYFDTMFSSGFAEGSIEQPSLDVSSDAPTPLGADTTQDALEAISTSAPPQFDDSDDEDDSYEYEPEAEVEGGSHLPSVSKSELPQGPLTSSAEQSMEDVPPDAIGWVSIRDAEMADIHADGGGSDADGDVEGKDSDATRNVRQKLSHPSTPRSRQRERELEAEVQNALKATTHGKETPESRKICVPIWDTAYATYRAFLYYIYTDTIVFAPLASTFYAAVQQKASSEESTPVAAEGQGNQMKLGASTGASASTAAGPASRREWIRTWETSNAGRPRPCSAKAVYRLADKLDLQELKERAFRHIVKSLTVENVAYEVFSTFSAAFEEVRKVQVSFFLEHWRDIRGSDAMRNVWQQIRMGRHPGFEEVWPIIAQNLEFKASSGND